MARTGRFGRLPTQAPDLSSQIVSLMEQWMNAEDRNILDAWTNGGKYKGKKVTDRDILNHYRKRRNSYDRDDPEWDEWDQDLWQVRYQIADEKVQMAYRMGKIGASAVAAHYRKWARKMPKRSSYYRNLMATAGDFAKAAAAGRSAGERGFDYQAMQDRINKLEREEKPHSDLFGALSKYAADRGFIAEGESLLDPDNLNMFEADDLGAILDGVREEMLSKAKFRDFRLGAEPEFPDWDGRRFTDAGLRDAVNDYVRIQRQKIRIWQKAPYDMSSYIAGARNAIRDARSYNRLIKQKGGYFDTASDLKEAWDIWTEGVQGAIDPKDVFSGDKNFRAALSTARNRYRRLGDSDTVAALDAIIKGMDATEGDVADLNELDPEIVTALFGKNSPWAQEGGPAEWAQNRAALKNAIPLMKDGTAAIMYNEQPTDVELATGAGAVPPFVVYTLEQNASGRTVATNPVTGDSVTLNDKYQIINGIGTEGMTTVLVEGREVYGSDEQGNATLVGFRYDMGGRTMWGEYDATGKLHYGSVNPWEQTAGTVMDDRGAEGIHVIVTGTGPAEGEAPVFEPIEQTLQRAMEGLEVQQPDATPDQIKEKRDGLQTLADHAIEGNFDDVDWNDPAVIDAMEAAFPEILAYAQNYGDPDAARVAIAKEYARQHPSINASIPFTDKDAIYVAPTGVLRSPGSAESLAQGQYPDIVNAAVGERNTIIVNAPEGQPFAQTVKEAQSQMPSYEPGGQALDMGYAGQEALDIFGTSDVQDPADDVRLPSDAIDEGIPGSVDPMQGARIYGRHSTLNAAFVLDDPNMRQLSQNEMDLFYKTTATSFNPATVEQEASTFNQQLATARLYGTLPSEVALAIESGASTNAITAGLDFGTGAAYADFEARGAADLERALPGWEVPLSEFTAGELQQITPKRPNVAVESMGERRLDQMLPVRPDPSTIQKEQPAIKLAANLVDPVAAKQNVKAPTYTPGPYGIPQPPGYRVSVQNVTAPKPVNAANLYPQLSDADWAREAKAAAAATPPAPPTIESAMKGLPRG